MTAFSDFKESFRYLFADIIGEDDARRRSCPRACRTP